MRVIAATHRDLPKLVKTGKFREDLFYRLNVIAIPHPAAARAHRGRPAPRAPLPAPLQPTGSARRCSTVSPEAIELLCGYRWPGNVRELENAVERAVVLCRGDTVTPADLPPAISGRTAPLVREAPATGDDASWLAMSYAAAKEQSLRRFEKSYVEALMRACDNNISAAARKAGMDRSNFKRVLRKYRTDVEGDGGDETPEMPPRASA